MSALMDLPEEMILAIGAFLPHPPDALQFTRVCRRTYHLTLPLLYDSIIFDYEMYKSTAPSWRDHGHLFSAIGDLCSMLESDGKNGNYRHFSAIRSLTFRGPPNPQSRSIIDEDTIDRLTSLRELYLENLPFDMVRPSMYDASSKTLKKLTLTTWKIGWLNLDFPVDDLSHLEALEYLDVLGMIYVDNDDDDDKDAATQKGWTTQLSDRLPPNLKAFHLRCDSQSNKEPRGDTDAAALSDLRQAKKAAYMLLDYLALPHQSRSSLRKVVMWLPGTEGREGVEQMRKAVMCRLDAVCATAARQGIMIVVKDF